MTKIGDLWTVKQAASVAKVSTATIRRLIDAGKLHAVGVGQSVPIPRVKFEKSFVKGGAK